MATLITETYLLDASTEDIIEAPSRLAAMPYNATLTVELSANVCDPNNNGKITIQTPGGDVPINNQIIPSGWIGGGTEAMLYNDTETIFVFDAPQGGHFKIDYEATGTLNLIMRVTIVPM